MRRQWSGKARTGAAAIGGVIAAALASPTAPVTAAPLPETPTASPRSETVVTRHTVTLLTGDVVLLEKTADGRQLASVRPPTDRQQISYQTRQIDGHAYVIPSDAIPLLADGTLDERLFDITQLVEYGYDDSRHASTPLIVQYAPSLSAKARTADLPGTTRTFTLESVNATAVQGRRRRRNPVDRADRRPHRAGRGRGRRRLPGPGQRRDRRDRADLAGRPGEGQPRRKRPADRGAGGLGRWP